MSTRLLRNQWRIFLNSRVSFLSVSALQKGLPFIMLPFMAEALGPTEYGHVSILAALFALVSMTAGLGQEGLVYRNAGGNFHSNEVRAPAIISRFFPLSVASLFAIIVVVVKDDFFGMPSGIAAMSIVASGIYVSAWQYPAALLRSQSRIGSFIIIAISYSLVLATAKFTAVIYFDLGIFGWAISDIAASVVVALCTIIIYVKPLRRSDVGTLSRSIRKSLRFGLPVVGSQLSLWAMGLSDRFLMTSILGPAATGQYSLAAQMVTIGNVLNIELTKFLQPRLSSLWSHSQNRQSGLLELRRHTLLILTIAFAVQIVVLVIVPVFFSSEFSNLVIVGLLLSIPLYFNGLAILGLEINSIVLGTTGRAAVASSIAAVLSILGNLVFMPTLGLSGAVIVATLTSIIYASLLWIPLIRTLSIPSSAILIAASGLPLLYLLPVLHISGGIG